MTGMLIIEHSIKALNFIVKAIVGFIIMYIFLAYSITFSGSSEFFVGKNKQIPDVKSSLKT